jgi:hypothetical protein
MSQPWDRMKGEKEGAYRDFLAYRDLGADRTLESARKTFGPPSVTLRSVEMLSSKWSWVERARAWDNHLQAERDRATAAAAAAEARKWEQRKQAAREANYTIAERLMERAQALLELPTVQQRSTKTDADGRTTVTVWEPAKWTQRDLPTIAKIAADLREVAIYTLEERNARQVVAAVTTHDADRDRSELNSILSAAFNRGGAAPPQGDHREGQPGGPGDDGVAGPLGHGPSPGDAEPEAG